MQKQATFVVHGTGGEWKGGRVQEVHREMRPINSALVTFAALDAATAERAASEKCRPAYLS